MPSARVLFFWGVLLLIAGCTKPVRQVALFSRLALDAAHKFARPLCKCVRNAVFLRGYDHKVFGSVVFGISVYVVYVKSFRGVCYDAMFVRPCAWLRNFYKDVSKAVSRFVQPLRTERDFYTHSFQHSALCRLGDIGKRFSSAVRAASGVPVRIAVQSLDAHNRRVAKWAGFEREFFRHGECYTLKQRIANAF